MSDRRTFINQSLLGASSLVLPSISLDLGRENSLGVALAGLGYYSENKLAPAFDQAQHCHLAGIVTGSNDKIPKWKEKYGLQDSQVYTYENFDQIAENDGIDIVYVVTPNALHRDLVIRAAKAGKHVICEKPMEVSAERCKQMVDACNEAGVLLQIGYRCQYDPTHQRFMEIGRNKELGEVKVIETGLSFYGVNSSNWRFTDASLSGGGPLMDIGVYCIQACRYTMGVDPIKVTAQSFESSSDKLPGMEETITWQFQYSNGAIANCTSSYVGRNDYIRVSAEEGWYEMKPAYGYATPMLNINGTPYPPSDHIQQATQMDAFAQNILNKSSVIADGVMGWKDMIIVEAIYKAARTGVSEDIILD